MFARCFHVLVVCLLLFLVVIECCRRGSAAVRDETKCSYSMEIKTADRSGAGTDNNILAQLSHGGIESDWIMLDNDGKDDFERNQVDTFTFDAKCFKSKPCVEMKNGGLAGWQHFLCRRFDVWKCAYVKLKMTRVGSKVGFSLPSWRLKITTFAHGFQCFAYKECPAS